MGWNGQTLIVAGGDRVRGVALAQEALRRSYQVAVVQGMEWGHGQGGLRQRRDLFFGFIDRLDRRSAASFRLEADVFFKGKCGTVSLVTDVTYLGPVVLAFRTDLMQQKGSRVVALSNAWHANEFMEERDDPRLTYRRYRDLAGGPLRDLRKAGCRGFIIDHAPVVGGEGAWKNLEIGLLFLCAVGTSQWDKGIEARVGSLLRGGAVLDGDLADRLRQVLGPGVTGRRCFRKVATLIKDASNQEREWGAVLDEAAASLMSDLAIQEAVVERLLALDLVLSAKVFAGRVLDAVQARSIPASGSLRLFAREPRRPERTLLGRMLLT